MKIDVGSVLSHNTITLDLMDGDQELPAEGGSALCTVVDKDMTPLPGATWPQDMIGDPDNPGKYSVTLPPELFPAPAGLYAMITAAHEAAQLSMSVPWVVMIDQGRPITYADAWAFAVEEGIVPGASWPCG